MRIITKRRKKSKNALTLKVDIVQAKELVVADSRSCIMMAGVALKGRRSKKTHKVKRTANPVWNSTLKVRLTRNSVGDSIIHIAVFDKHRKYSIYLGELRLSILDLFSDTTSGKLRFKVLPKWYKLHSSSSQSAFVTGSIKVGFQLLSKGDIVQLFLEWKRITISGTKKVRLNEQGYYSDSDTDVECLIFNDEGETDLNDSSVSRLSLNNDGKKSITGNTLYLEPPSLPSGSGLEDFTSDTSLADYSTPGTPLYGSSSHTSASVHFGRPSSPSDHIAGVLFLQIESASNLPPFKRFIKKGFGMDPFVVISCGKKTFRTSWRKHTVNPVFNEKLAFEVLSKETHYDLMFNIFDKDHISFNDKVAHGSIALSNIINQREFIDQDVKLTLHNAKHTDCDPHLRLKIKFVKYNELKQNLLASVLSKYSSNQNLLDIVQLTSFLEDANIDEDLESFFTINNKSVEEYLTIPEIISVLESHQIQLSRCPICEKRKKSDMVLHLAICSYKVNKLKTYATADLASRRWYSKVLIKFAYGKYALGKNNANILVQDRLTGFITEEKMSLYIRLGIRLLYKGKGADSRRIRNLLKSLSIKQGAKFDDPSSIKDIESFVKFYKLDLSECAEDCISNYKTFNEFFFRKLKPTARRPESPDPRMILSAADSRCTTFQSITQAKTIWIKSRSFTVMKLLGSAHSDEFNDCSIAIFRLAPQDYHRFHSPVTGIVGKLTYIQGEYYTVNPMAIRSGLDVYGENVRVIIPIDTAEFGKVIVVSVGAMMVGSTVLTVSEGDKIARGSELGYFKFGGSTIIALFKQGTMMFDSDLNTNSAEGIETLVRVGMCVGHRSDVEEFKRKRVSFNDETDEAKLRIIRTITGGDNDRPWEFYNLNVYSDDDYEDEESDFDEEGTDDDDDENGEKSNDEDNEE